MRAIHPTLGHLPYILAVHPSVAASNLQELIAQGLQPESTTSAAFARYVTAEITKWTTVARKANLKPERE